MRIKGMIRIAIDFTSAGDSRRDYFLGAIGERADGVVVMARNESTKGGTPSAHAEAGLVSKLGINATLVIVVRVAKGTGCLAMAKPCPDCARSLKRHRVKKTLFSNDSGKIVRLSD